MKVDFEYLGNQIVCRFSMRSMLAALKKLGIAFENIGDVINFLSFILVYIECSLPETIKDRQTFLDDLQNENSDAFEKLIIAAKDSLTNNMNFFSKIAGGLQA